MFKNALLSISTPSWGALLHAQVSERGQIVIPSKARGDFNIKHGDLLLVVAGTKKGGIALIKADVMKEFVTRILKGLELEGQK